MLECHAAHVSIIRHHATVVVELEYVVLLPAMRNVNFEEGGARVSIPEPTELGTLARD